MRRFVGVWESELLRPRAVYPCLGKECITFCKQYVCFRIVQFSVVVHFIDFGDQCNHRTLKIKFQVVTIIYLLTFQDREDQNVTNIRL